MKNINTDKEDNIKDTKSRLIFSRIALIALLGTMLFLLAGCSGKDVSNTLRGYFSRQASLQEETAELSIEDRMFTAQVNAAGGEPLTLQDGEPVTILAAYETAQGGEPRINEKGEPQIHPIGQVMTYKAGEEVTDEDGITQTYAGDEPVTDVFGNALKDQDGNYITHSAGEPITHGDSDIMYDEQGKAMRYSGEPMTYAYGEYMYDTSGEQVFSGIVFLEDEYGRPAINEDGSKRFSPIEIVTDESGEPLTEEDGEAATRVLEPLLPQREIDQPLDEGLYYIRNIASEYVYFSGPSVPAENVHVPEGAEPDALQSEDAEDAAADNTASGETLLSGEQAEKETSPKDVSAPVPMEMINNLQLEVLGGNLPYFELRFDAKGYGYFVMQDTELVLGIEGSIRNGANVALQEMEKIPYPQYEYWDDPLYTLEDHQKWILKELPEERYEICSAANQDYCLTVDDFAGIHYANIMLWKFDDRDQQKFVIESEVPVVKQYVEPDTYFIRTDCSNWMMLSIGDENFDDYRNVYIWISDGMNGQMFDLSYDDYGLATIIHHGSTKALTVENGEAVNGQNIFQYEYDGQDWQKWIIEPAPEEKGYIIRSARNVSEVMNLMGGAAVQQQPVKTYWNDNTPSQNWYFLTEAPEAPSTMEAMARYAQKYYSDTGYLILVNTFTNYVGIYTGWQGNWSTLFYWPCVTGKPSTPTVKGEFTINFRIPSFDGDTDSPALYTCYYATNFYPEYYFHSIVYYQGTKDIMDGSMGWNASHGCIRLYIENAQWIYENIPDGTKVAIF